ncbi:hypothetical protein RBB50_006309 [Rhinocladiella similis]
MTTSTETPAGAVAPSKHRNTRVILYSLIIALAACSFGFDQSETGGFLAMPAFNKDFGSYDPATKSYAMSARHQTLMYGVEVAFIAIGSVGAGFISMYKGRKFGLYLCAIATIVGAGLQMISHYVALVVGRAVMGLSVGFAAAFSIAYWSEIAPAHLRGRIVIFYQFFLNMANFIGSCIDQGTHNMLSRWAYRAPLLTMMGPAFLMLGLVWIIPESPRYLVTQDQSEKAKTNLRKIRGPSYTDAEVEEEIEETIKFTALEKELDASTSYLDCFRGTDRRRTLIAVMMMVGQQFMGVAFLAGYMTYFFALVGFTDAFVVSVIANAVAIGGTVAAFPIVKYLGRRRTMIVGAFINAFCMLSFASISDAHPGSKAAAKCLIAFICIFSFTYSATWGSIGPIVIGEVPSNHLRTKTVSIALGLSFLMALLVITSIPYLIGAAYLNLGTKIGFIFGGLTVLVWIGTMLYLPETKDRTLEEIDEMFLNRIPTRAFRTYVCTHQVAGYDLTGDVKDGVIHNEYQLTPKAGAV